MAKVAAEWQEIVDEVMEIVEKHHGDAALEEPTQLGPRLGEIEWLATLAYCEPTNARKRLLRIAAASLAAAAWMDRQGGA